MLIRDLLETTALDEVKMSPGSLRSMASKVDAKVGMEFEMYIPGADAGEREADYQPDYEMDGYISTGTWKAFEDDLTRFFTGGDFADMSRPRFKRFFDEDVSSEFNDWCESAIREWAEEGEFSDWWAEENPDEDEPAPGSRGYERAMVDFHNAKYDGWMSDGDRINDWLEAERIDKYRTFAEHFDLSWPYMRDANEDRGGRTIDEIADEFGDAVGIPTDHSESYHTRKQRPGHYMVEPDSSLNSPESEDDAGLEFVSPALTVDEMIDQLEKVKRWADYHGAYTNESTGLHINVSLPGYSIERLDYIKLALFLGDEWVSQQFDRLGNTYAKSAIGEIKQRIRGQAGTAPGRLSIEGMMKAVKAGMAEIASKIIHSAQTEKYVSINTKDNRIEFRSPGGDWLDTHWDKIIPTMLRFIVAMDIALDPKREQREYAKKLYQLLASVMPGDDDTIKYFSKYAAGELPAAALKSFVRNVQSKRADIKTGKMWMVVDKDGTPISSVQPFKANDREHAISIIMPMLRSGEIPTTADVRPAVSAPAPAPDAPRPSGPWVDTMRQHTSGERSYDIIFHQSPSNSRVVHTFTAASPRAAERYAESWAREHDIGARYSVRLSGSVGEVGTFRFRYRNLQNNQTGEMDIDANSRRDAVEQFHQMMPNYQIMDMDRV